MCRNGTARMAKDQTLTKPSNAIFCWLFVPDFLFPPTSSVTCLNEKVGWQEI